MNPNSDETLQNLLRDAARPDCDENDPAALEAALDEAASHATPLTEETVLRMVKDATSAKPISTPKTTRWQPWLWTAAAAAAVVLTGVNLMQPPTPPAPPEIVAKIVPTANPDTAPVIDPVLPQIAPVKIDSYITKAHERRVERLKDDSLLYLDENTRVTISSAREIKLEAGRAYVEVARQVDTAGKRIPFTMQTPQGSVVALGTKFAVDLSKGSPEVLVTEGKVAAAGLAQPLLAGQWWRGSGVETAPQAVHGLGWTRELRMLIAPPPVPPSQDLGGALRSTDGSAVFTLRRCHVDVHVEDGMARTTIDQTYFNHLPSRQEGTFYFPLPPDASISRLAMYVNGKLMEGGMAEREEARRTFETIKHKMQDPALLEWVDGSTFKMRVFPLEGREEKRIVISYVQKLDTLHGRSTLRVPLGHSLGKTGQWSFLTRIKDGRDAAWRSMHHDLKAEQEGSDLLLSTDKTSDTMQRDVVLEIATPESTAPRLSSFDHEGARYLALRWTPDLPAAPPPPSRHWVFLVETSADRDRVLAQTQREVLRGILGQASADDTFQIVTASTRTTTLAPKQAVTAANRDAALKKLENEPNLGALNLGESLGALKKDGDSTVVVHLGSATPILGETDNAKLLAQLPEGCVYASIGIGKRWNLPFARAAAAKTGGWFTRINPDESPGWRAFEFMSAMNAARLVDVKLDGADWLLMSETLAHGSELCAVAKLSPNAKLPQQLRVSGTLSGQPWLRDLKLDAAPALAGWLPRAWAKLELDRLVAAGAEKNRSEIVALSKSSYVMSPFTSLLVLENDAMYEQYKIDRGRKDHWAMYPCPEVIPVVKEPLHSGNTTKDESKNDQDEEEQVKRAMETLEHLLDGNVIELNLPTEESDFEGFINYGSPIFDDGDKRHAGMGVVPTTRGVGFGVGFGSGGGFGKGGSFDKPSTITIGGFASDSSASFFQSGAGTLVLAGLNTYTGATTINAGTLDVSKFTGRDSFNFSGGEGGFISTSGASISNGTVRFDELVASTPGATRSGFGGGFSSGYKLYSNQNRLYRTQIYGVTNSMLALRAGLEVPGMLNDLTLYADGFMTTMTDRQAVAESVSKVKLGAVEAGARALVDAARAASKIEMVVTHYGEKWTVAADGRALRDHRNVFGLREVITQDGETLRHLYPEIGLGTVRSLSRVHWLELRARFPWLLPPVELLARDADVKIVSEQSIEIIPHDAAKAITALFFAPGGDLAEIQLLEPKTRRKLSSMHIEREGHILTVSSKNAQGHETHSQQWKVAPAEANKLQAKVNPAEMVILPMPARRSYGAQNEDRLAQLSSSWLMDRQRLPKLIADLFKGDKRIGLSVLAMSAEDENRKGSKTSLLVGALFARGLLEKSQISGLPSDLNSFLGDFMSFRKAWKLCQEWTNKGTSEDKRREKEILDATDTPGWTTGAPMLRRIALQKAHGFFPSTDNTLERRMTAALDQWRHAQGDWRLDAVTAAEWLDQGDAVKAAELFTKWVEMALEQDALTLPPPAFSSAFERAKQEQQGIDLVKNVVAHLMARDRHVAALQFAASAVRDDKTLLELVQRITTHAPADRTLWAMAAEVYASKSQVQEAVVCLRKALKIEAGQDAQILWRLVQLQADLATSRKKLGINMDAAELAEVRAAVLKLTQTDDLGTMSRMLAPQLDLLDLRELAHDCRTTPLALKPNESQPWIDYASDCGVSKRVEEALTAYERAFAAEGTNAQTLLTHAQFLENQQRPAEARKLHQKIADGTWGPNYNWVVQQAKQKLGRQ